MCCGQSWGVHWREQRGGDEDTVANLLNGGPRCSCLSCERLVVDVLLRSAVHGPCMDLFGCEEVAIDLPVCVCTHLH